MNPIEKWFEEPIPEDGSLRRRLVTGLIFGFVVAADWILSHPSMDLAEPRRLGFEPKDVIQSTQFLVIAVGFVFAIGSIIDAMTEGFIMRGVSTTLRLLNRMLEPRGLASCRFRLGLWKFGIIAATILLWPLAIVVATILSSMEKFWLYEINWSGTDSLTHKTKVGTDSLTHKAKEFLDNALKCPSGLQDALTSPFGVHFDVGWQVLINLLPKPQALWASNVAARNRDLGAFLSSMFFALWLACGLQLTYLPRWHGAVIPYALLCLTSWLLFGCFAIIRRTVIATTELAALIDGLPKREDPPLAVIQINSKGLSVKSSGVTDGALEADGPEEGVS
jgi:hypothetical protein